MLSNKPKCILSLAACLGIAFLLLSGNALAGITTSHSPLPTYALQVGGANNVYTVTPAASFTRQIQATRNQYNAPNSSFLLRVDLLGGFLFAAGGLPAPGDIYSYVSSGGAGGANTGINLSGVEIYDGGQAGDNYVRYYIPTSPGSAIAFTSATITIRPNPWKLKDVLGNLTGLHGDVKYMDVKATLFEVQGLQQFDSDRDEATDTAHLIKAANGIDAAVVCMGKKVIDLENTRLYFEGHDPVTDDTSRVKVKPITDVLGLNGAQYVFGSEIVFYLTATGNFSGIVSWQFDGSSSITPTITLPGTNIPSGHFGHVTFNVDGITPLDSRVLNLTITYASTSLVPKFPSDTILPETPLTEWVYNGSMLISSYSNANTDAWRTRFYIWNYDKDPSSILVRVLTLPINGAIGSQAIGLGQVVYRYTIAGNSGITIKLEDVLVDIDAAGPQLGPDGNGNMYVEFSFGSSRTVGWTQIFDPTASTFMGMIQMHNTVEFDFK